jgi:hypothetical protein
VVVNGRSRGVVRSALSLAPGSSALIACRWGLLVASSLPALLVLRAKISSGPALSPYYTSVVGPLPFVHLMRLMIDLSSVMPVVFAAPVLAVLGDQLLTAGAVSVLAGRSSRVWTSVFRESRRQFWPFVRLVFLGAIAIAAGAAAFGRLAGFLRDRGMREGWTGMTTRRWALLLSLALILLWNASIGAWMMWARAMAALDERRCARRTGWLALRALARHPLSGLATYVIVSLATLLATGALLAAWFAAEPRTLAGVGLWTLMWLVAPLAQAYVWHWMVRAACMMEGSPRLDDLRAAPDEPFRLLRRGGAAIARRLRKPRPAIPPSFEPPDLPTPLDDEPPPSSETDAPHPRFE